MEEGPIVVITVRQVAEWVRGEVLGDGELAISHARSLVDAQPGDITFVEDEKRLGEWYKSKASAAIVPMSVPVNGRPLIRVADPLMAFVNVYQQLRSRPVLHTGSVDPSAHVHPSVSLEPGVTIGAGVVVGEGTEIGTGSIIQANSVVGRFCKIGRDVNLYPHVVVYDDSVIGDRTIIHSNSVIGADGLGYRMQGGKHVKVPQLGWVEIASDVEIGACTTVDRGTFGPTRIGHGTKIDNLVQIAHNCQIGRHNIIASQVGIAGSATTGDYVVMAGQSGVADHLHVGDRAIVGARAGACKDIPPDCTTLGMPAIPSREFWRRTFSLAKLPDLIKEVDRIKNHLGMEDA